jgi:hypothetical protein
MLQNTIGGPPDLGGNIQYHLETAKETSGRSGMSLSSMYTSTDRSQNHFSS